jgi:hypothetical protein
MIYKTLRAVGRALFAGWRRNARAQRAAERVYWDGRIADVLACPDNVRLSRVADAGRIVNGHQVMHNGLKVVTDGYYGEGVTRMLVANGGCHEPQEEVVFDAILRALPMGATMVEVGAYWGFYSMWFCQAVQGARVFLVEPNANNLAVGQRNFSLNGLAGDFTQAYIGNSPGIAGDGVRIVTVESLLREKGLTRLNILHADIQGFELQMLEGARKHLALASIDYLFISTHTMELHEQCVEFLRALDYRVLVSVNMEESHSYDGILVASSPRTSPPSFDPPCKKVTRPSQSSI